MAVYINGVEQGGNVIYTELDGSVNTTALAQGGGDSTWVTWDLSGALPLGVKGVDIMVKKLVAADIIGCKKSGSALARQLTAIKGQVLTLPTEIGDDRILEIMSNDVSDLDVFSLMGYWS